MWAQVSSQSLLDILLLFHDCFLIFVLCLSPIGLKITPSLFLSFLKIVIMVAAIKLSMANNISFVYLVPYALFRCCSKLSLIRLAFFVFLMGLLLIGFMVPSDFSFLFMQLVAGAIATLSVTDLYKRANLFVVVVLIVSSYVITYVSFHLIYEANISTVSLDNMGFLLINGLGILFVHPLVYVFEDFWASFRFIPS